MPSKLKILRSAGVCPKVNPRLSAIRNANVDPENLLDGVSEVIQADYGIPAAHLGDENERHDRPRDRLQRRVPGQ
jgi:hypothetical protein